MNADGKPSWKDAPEWANFLTLDSSGWWWWENRPTLNEEDEYLTQSSDQGHYEECKTGVLVVKSRIEQRLTNIIEI